MARVRPKYPRRGKWSRIRLPALGLLLLCLVAGGVFYRCTREDRQVERAVEQLADSLTARSSRAADGGLSPGTVAPSPKRDAPRRDAPRRAPSGQGAPERTAPEQGTLQVSEAPPFLPGGAPPSLPGEAPPSLSGEAPPSLPGGAPPSPPRAGAFPEKAAVADQDRKAPFADLTLERIASAFAGTYGKMTPVHWGERLPGVTWRLGVSGPASSTPPPSGQAPAAPAPAHPAGAGKPVLALTLDACDGKKGSGYDAGIIALLREKNIPATIFVTSIWMRNNPEALRELAADPLFEIAAHGTRHRPCSVTGRSVYGIKGTASFAELVQEVEGNARDIRAATGKRPRWFRSGTAYYDDVAVRVIRDLELGIAGYSMAGDEGASLSAARVAAKTLAAKDGDILLYHLNRPRSGTRAGLERALPVLLEKGFTFVRLSPE